MLSVSGSIARLFVLLTALAWMALAMGWVERRHIPQLDRWTDLPEASDAVAVEKRPSA